MTMIDMTNLHTRMMVQLIQARSALGIEVNVPGLRNSRGSVLNLVRSWETLIPNAYSSLMTNWAGPGPDGVLVTREGELFHGRITLHSRKWSAWEDLDARIAMLGGPVSVASSNRLQRPGKDPEAQARKHNRRIVKILEQGGYATLGFDA